MSIACHVAAGPRQPTWRRRALAGSRPPRGARGLLLCGTALLALSLPLPVAHAADITVANGETRALGTTTTTDAVLVGAGTSGTLNIAPGSTLTVNTTDASTLGRIEIGNGGSGVLNLTGGTIRFNIAASSAPAPTAIGRLWVGGGVTNTTGGTGTFNLSSGLLEYVELDPATVNFGGLAIGRGLGVTGSFNQSGGTVRFSSTGAIDIGTQGGTGSYALSGNAILDMGSGGGTIYVGSRTGTGGVTSTGSLRISDNASLTLTTGANSGGQLYVGDARSTGSITQNGAGSVVTLGLANPILFGGNVNNAGGTNGGGTGSYALSAGTLNVLNVGGSQQLSFGAAAGGRGDFLLSGGTANIATNLSIGAVAGSTGLLRQTGGTLSLTGASRLYVGAGTGSYELLGGRLQLGGSAALYGGGSLTFGGATLAVQGSNLTIADAATLAASSLFTIDTQGFNASLSGVLSGSGGLAKAGAGTLTLSAAETYTGPTTISAGTLALSGAGSIASSSGLVDNGIFDVSATTAGAVLANLSGTGRVDIGLRSLAVGTDNSSTAFSGTIANGGVNWDPSYGVFAKVGTGTLTLDGATISGGEAHVRGGRVAVTSGATRVDYFAVGTGRTSGVSNVGNLDVSGGALTVGTTLQLGDFGGIGTVTQTGGSVVVDQLCGTSSHCAAVNIGNQGGTGSYNISAGDLTLLRASLALGRNTATNPAGSGTLNLSGTGLVDLTDGRFNIGNWVSVGVGIPRSSGLINQTGGTLRIRSGGVLYLSGSGNGVYDLLGGTLEIGGTSLRANYGGGSGTYAFNLGGGTIRTIGSALVAPVNATLLAGTQSTIDSNALGTTWSGVLSGSGGLRKTGAGTLTLSAANSYTGPTTISAGTLALTGAGSIAASSGLVDNGVFDISGTTLGASIANLSGSGRVETGVRLLQVGTDNSDTAFSGTIVNGGLGWLPSYGRFQKLGTGTLTLSGATISGGESYVTGGAVAQTSGQTLINYLAVGSGRTSGVANVGALNVSGGSLTFGTGLQVGDFGGSGTVNQTGGAILVRADCGDAARCALFNIGNQGGTGIYNISGGSLTLDSGSFGLGRNTSNNPASTGTLNLSGTGLVDLTAGFFTIGNWIVVNGTTTPGSGVINQTGGTFRIGNATNLYLSGSGNGTYNLLGGALEIGGTSLNANYNGNGGSYQLNLGGGTIRASGTALTASVNATLLDDTLSTIDSNALGVTLSGVFSGDGGLAKTGAGTLSLTGANSYTGGTTVSAGTLQIGAGGTTGSLVGDVVDNATLTFNRSDAVTFGGVISGSGAVVKAGASTLTLTGANSYTGPTTIAAGTLALSGGGRIVGSVVNDATFDISATTGGNVVVGGLSGAGGVTLGSRTLGLSGSSGVFSGTISGTGGLALTSGMQILTGANSYTGGTTISGGTLQLGDGGTTGSIFGSIVDNGTLSFNRSDAVTFGQTISGTGSLLKVGAGTLTLTGANSYSGGTTISTGTLALAGAGRLVGGVAANGSFDISATTGADVSIGGLSGAGNVALGARNLALSGAGGIFSGSIAGSGALTLLGGTQTLAGTNSYAGGTTIAAGTLRLGAGGTTGSVAGNVTINGELLIDRSDDVSLNGVLTGSGSLTKVGSNRLTLTAANSYAGGTTIAAGTLALTGGGRVTGNIVDNGALIFSTPDSLTFGGAISGSGTLTQAGSGTLTLTGVAGHGGGTTIAAGTVALSGAGRITGSVANNGILDIGATTGAVALQRLTGTGTVALGSQTLTLTAASGTFAGTIAGSGGLGVSGGTQVLTGANSYTGGTLISAGTLQIGDGGATGSIAGNVIDNGSMIFNRSNALLFGGAISGAGAVVKSGAGALTLTGANSYGGGTTIAAGTLEAARSDALGSGLVTVGAGTTLALAGDVVLANRIDLGGSAAVSVATGTQATVGGVIGSGATTGALVKAGGGTLTLTAANSYAGGTTIAAGTLRIGAGGTVAGNVSNAGVLEFARADRMTFGGTISGSGALLHSGPGTTILTADHSYAGGTTINSGTVQIGAGGSSGSIIGDIVDNGVLSFNRADDLTVAGRISGTGSVTHAGAGTLTLAGASSYGGGTTIGAGTLRIADGGSIVGNVANGGTLQFDRTGSFGFAGTISGAGAVIKSGVGTLTLAAANDYAGGTVVRAGTLALAADRSAGTGRITLESGTTLAYAPGITVANDLRINGLATLSVASGVATQSGALSGAGRYTLGGGGRLLLTGDNSGFSGLVSVSGLTLDLFSSAALGSGLVELTGNTGFRYGDGVTIGNALSLAAGTTLAAVVEANQRATQAGPIDGAGALTKSGAGTLRLAGDNRFSGGTALTAGTLEVARSAALGAGRVGMADGTTLALADNIDVANRIDLGGVATISVEAGLAPELSGAVRDSGVAGGLIKVGAGTLTLSGASSYTGGTLIAGGAIEIAGNNALGTGLVDIDDGSALLLDGGIIMANELDLSGLAFIGVGAGLEATISGEIEDGERRGTLVKTGAGALTLTGANRYGTTRIAEGTLRLRAGGSIAGDVSNAGRLVFDRSDRLTFGGTISGAGAVVQSGSGTTILTADNSYGGGTIITAGILQVGGGGTTGSIAGDVVNDGALTFDRSDAVSLAGRISGLGSLTQAGGGMLTLTGANSYGGGTTIGGGTLRIGDGGISGSLVGDVVNGGTLIFDRAGTLAFDGAISGSGSLVKAGAGLLSLSAANSYRGDTTVRAGTLLLANDRAAGSGRILLEGGTTLSYADGITVANELLISGEAHLDVAAGIATQAGAITGAGRYTLTGNGRLLLIGDNSSFTGPVTITGVSLELDSSTALGSGEVELTGDATLSYGDGLEVANEVSVTAGATLAAVVSEGSAAVQAGAITGDGAVAKTGTGTMILTADNDYSGGTTITGGVLQVGSGGTSGSITGKIANEGTLAFNRSDTLVFTGAISGSGAVLLNSPGTVVLTGQNNYSGGTAISGGTLALSGEGRISGPVVNNGVFDIGGATGGPVAIAGLTGQGTVSLGSQTLALDGANASFAGTITGSGAVMLTGGSQMLTGTNTHSGGTNIAGGTLIATAGALGTGPIVGNGSLVIEQGADARLSNPLSGSGTLIKSGNARLDLTGVSDFSGTTQITGGRLAVNGVLANSVVSAEPGTILSGSGTVGGVALSPGAALAPGNSIGTLTVAGNVVQAAGSIYDVEVDPATNRSDRIVAQGSATIAAGAVLNVIKETPIAYVPGRVYTVLTAAGGITGRYTLTGDTAISAFYALTDRYAPQSVTLEAAQVRAFSAAAATGNQIAVADGLNSLAVGNGLRDVVAMYSDDASARTAFEQLSGEIDASLRTALTEGSRFSREAVLDEIRAASCGVSIGDVQRSRCGNGARVAWGRIFGSSGNAGDSAKTEALDFSARGIVAGLDVAAGERGRAGFYAGASRSRFSVDARASGGESDNREVGAYAGGQWGGLGLRLGAGYTWHDVDTTRIVVITNFADRLSRAEKARTLQAFGEIGYRLGAGPASVEPFAGLAYVDLDTRRSSESGGAAGLDSFGTSTRSTLSTIGLRLGWMEAHPGSPIGLAGSLAWRHAYGSIVPSSTLAFAGGDSFRVEGAALARDAALIEVGIHTRVTPTVTWNLDYSGQLGGDIQDHGLRGSLSWRF